MGLNIVVGMLAELDESELDTSEPDDLAGELCDDFRAIGRALAAAGLPAWTEPDAAAVEAAYFDMYGYAGLHTLRRLAAHLASSGELPPPAPMEVAVADPLLKDTYSRGPRYGVEIDEGTRVIGSEHEAGSAYDHLIHHSDCEGFYVPVDFAAVFYDKEISGGWVGSSQRLLEECRGIAARLGLPEDLDPWGDEVSAAVEADTEGAEGWRRYGVESFTCLQVMAAARHSVATGAAIVLC
ncbi:hypothetical protein [Microbispora catharanthi]|uniref:Uncharacterized protein n=1 Tax=Microbispora catharanthi TaxID=1712871 RepID=A0A5N6BW10_9ACTN|nr:hypothetical protein [Microbispora catharanthi]KAB8184627.1 hypothetical protein FH610_016235 [Microbispora catharanthi]